MWTAFFNPDVTKSKSIVLSLLILNLSLQPLVPLSFVPFLNVCCLLCTGFSWIKQQPIYFQLGLIIFITQFYTFGFYPVWPLPLFLSILLIRGMDSLTQDARFSYEWFKWGSLNGRIFCLCVLFILISSAFLFLWLFFLKPDLNDLKANYVPSWPILQRVTGGLIFSLINAFSEEFLFRGILFHTLSKHFKSVSSILLIQAVPFACLHINGFPRGLIGMGLAFLYALMMGTLRDLSRGLLTAWLVHVFADR